MKDLKQQRDALLESNPELKPLQKKIEKALGKQGSSKEKRTKVMVSEMMSQYGTEISTAAAEMKNIERVVKEIQKKRGLKK